MSSTQHYKSNLRDIFFNLYEFFKVQDFALGRGPFENMDLETSQATVTAFEAMCTNEFSQSFVESDRVPLKLDGEGNVTLPEGLVQSLNLFYEQEWNKLELPEHLGGFGTPRTMYWAAFELLVGANPAACFYLLGNFVPVIIDRLGTESQKKRFVNASLDNHWGGTMVLTEPGAGSDVGAGRSKATHIKDDVYEIEGVKRFITNGDFNGTDNILHLVLARPEGAGPGTKGLSLFVVPKFWVNEDGSLGERNGAFCTNIEDKMGLKGSSTCEMTFGGDIPCRGVLLGDVHDGIKQMFHVIEYARMGVGVKSSSTLSTAYLNSLEYAKDRVQGPDLKNMLDKSAPKVAIINHPDVRRNLMQLKAYSEGLRALNIWTASLKDKSTLAALAGEAEQAKDLDKQNDLLLPIVKGFASEKCFALLADALQVLGGSGYCKDYPHEQYIRDQKIDTLYEGTTHMQALDLIFRKVMRDNGKQLTNIMTNMANTLASEEGGDTLADARVALGKSMAAMQGMLEGMLPKAMESVYHVGLHANRILFSLGDTLIGWLLIRQAAVAVEALPDAVGDDVAFYQGKIAAAKFFAQERLPEVVCNQKIIAGSVLDLMELDEAAF